MSDTDFNTPNILAEDMGCGTSPIENDCFCRADLQQNAENIIRSCVNNDCQETQDVNSAVSLYDAYCTGAGFTADAATTAATGMPNSNTPATVTITRIETVTASSGQQRLMSPMEVIVQLVGY